MPRAWSEGVQAHALYVLGVAAMALSLPMDRFNGAGEALTRIFLLLGVLAVWRYSWGALHFLRAIVYRAFVFPRMRARADRAARAVAESGSAPHAYLLVTSFRISGDTSAAVYRAAFRAALNAPGRATVVASIVELSDQRLVSGLHRLVCGDDSNVDLIIVRIAGTGKRDALAFGFRAIARREPAPDDVVAVIDGDSLVPPDLVIRCAGFFRSDQRVGALTTDERGQVLAGPLFQHWYALRFAQRHVLMSSMGLARRVLTLTGRMAMFRAGLVCNPSFIRQIEFDWVDHWRFGRFRFLTGDDKSSWFWLLSHGHHMIYVPDVVVTTIEEPPSPGFLDSTARLMTRWFGNMLRTNARALALGPRRIGPFTWWSILDQRLSMWTSLAGLVMVMLVGLFMAPIAFLYYFVWILASRYVMTMMLLGARPRVSIFYPPLLYFNQIFGAYIKIFILFRLHRQTWTRQNTKLADGFGRARLLLVNFSSTALHCLAIFSFVSLSAFAVGLLHPPTYWPMFYESSLLVNLCNGSCLP